MPRRVQDIIPNTHRSIRDIPVERPAPTTASAPTVSPKKRLTRPVAERKIDIDTNDDSEPVAPIQPPKAGGTSSRSRRRSGAKVWLYLIMGIVVLVAIVGYLASVYFSHAVFTVVPKSVPFSVDSTYISQATPGKGVLTYELAIIKGDATATVPATDGPKISSAAKGKVTLYNSYGPQSQRLIAGTRLSDDSGRIYRLASSVVIPGSTVSGSNTLPGSLSTVVVADQPGQSYNITKSDPVSDFKIVAYKGTSKYEAIYARIAGDITGGFLGAKKTINPGVLASTTADLQSKIISGLLEKLKTSLPSGYIMYPKAYTTAFAAPIIGGSDPKSATVTLQGTVYGILFKKSDLVLRVAGEQAVSTFDNFAFDTPGLESLDFNIANSKDFSPEKKNTLIIKLKGDAMLVGSIPVDEIKRKLAGLSLADTSAVFRSFKPVIDIEKSSGSVTPPWSNVPSDLDRITVEIPPAGSRTAQ